MERDIVEEVARIVDDYHRAQAPAGVTWSGWDDLCEDERSGARIAAHRIIERLRTPPASHSVTVAAVGTSRIFAPGQCPTCLQTPCDGSGTTCTGSTPPAEEAGPIGYVVVVDIDTAYGTRREVWDEEVYDSRWDAEHSAKHLRATYSHVFTVEPVGGPPVASEPEPKPTEDPS